MGRSSTWRRAGEGWVALPAVTRDTLESLNLNIMSFCQIMEKSAVHNVHRHWPGLVCWLITIHKILR